MRYKVSITAYPKDYNVEAETKAEAREIATDLWHEETGKGVWESEVIEDEE